jgi:calcineurin-like phosphoesterase family protein
MIYFWSDTHFNHEAVIRYTGRPDANVEAMNERLAAAWNRTVTPRDTIYLLGDFAFARKGTASIPDLFGRLNGHKHLIVGNHDEKNTAVMRLPWESVSWLKVVKENNRKAVLCHYPIESWPSAHHGALHFHGHSHGSLKRAAPHRFDVGVDVFAAPVSFPALVAMADAQAYEAADHHGDDL